MAEFDVDKRLAEIQTENEKLKKRIEEELHLKTEEYIQ